MKNQLREVLADYAHTAWSGWMKYMFSKSDIDKDGNLVIPHELYARWYRQMHTSYEDLSEKEKDSDKKEADRMSAIFEEAKSALSNLSLEMKEFVKNWSGGMPTVSLFVHTLVNTKFDDDQILEVLKAIDETCE